MSASAPEVAESSRAGQEAEQAPESEPQRKWVALVSAAVLLGNEDERAEKIRDGTDVLFDLNDPPMLSYLVLHPRVAPLPRRNDEPLSAYILAGDRSGCILLQVLEGNLPDFFLCNTHGSTVNILPPAGSHIHPHLSIGLIADPHNPGHYVVAQLHRDRTPSSDNPIKLLCYFSAKGRWFTMGLTLRPALRRNPFSETGVLAHESRLWPRQIRIRDPFSETGVLAHGNRLWWLALAYGVFFWDLLQKPPQLRFLPLPADCEMEGDDVGFDPRIRTLIAQRRCFRPSEGKLRFVDIRGLSYDELVDVPAANPIVCMWTLGDLEGPKPWTLEYEVAFTEIWENKTYADAGLLPSEVPHVALVDPNDHYVVYFFQGSKLFGLDMREKKVVACKECPIDRDHQPKFRCSASRPIVDAWEQLPPPPALPEDDDSSPDGDAWWRKSYAETKKRQVTESVESWLNQARSEWTRDTDASVESWRTWKMAPPSDESSVNSGGQADDELEEIQQPPLLRR